MEAFLELESFHIEPEGADFGKFAMFTDAAPVPLDGAFVRAEFKIENDACFHPIIRTDSTP